MRSVFAPVVLLLTGAAPAIAEAENSTIAMVPAPEWVEPTAPAPVPEDVQGPIFVRKQVSHIHLTAEGQRTYLGQVVRILQPQALQIGNVSITWNPASGQPQVHALKIHRGNHVIDVLENASFEILRREDQLEQAMLDGLLTAVLRVPDLRVGDDLELEFSIPGHDPTLRQTSHGLLFLVDSPAAGHFRLGLSWENGQEPEVRMTPEFASLAQRDADSISLVFDNPEVISAPRAAPPRYNWMRILEFTDFEDWQAVSRRFHSLFEKASQLAPDSPLKQEAAIIAASHPGKLAQAQAALELVQQQVRYIYIGLEGGNFSPATADETWQRRYGDCKGKTVMLLALLRELGIEAEAVLANNSVSTDGLENRLANPGHFDHVLVRAKIGGRSFWLDGTLPAVIEIGEKPPLPYETVLPLSHKGSGLEKLPLDLFDLPQTMVLTRIDARAGFDAPGKITRTTITRGLEGLGQYMQLSSVTANQLQTALVNRLNGSEQWDSVENVEYRFDRATRASILTITGSGPIDWEGDADGSYYLYLPGGGFTPPNRRKRDEDSDRSIPYYQARDFSCHVTTVHLPDDTSLDHWAFNSLVDTMLFGKVYYRMMELREDRTMRLVRGSRVQRTEIGADQAERDNGRLERFDNSKAVLTYDPAGFDDRTALFSPVPSTEEIDWLAPGAPCLPADMVED